MRKTFFFFGFSFFLSLLICADTYSGGSAEKAVIVRSPVWVFLEPVPGSFDDSPAKEITPPKEALKELSRYILAGMVYGWKFSYTPYDKKRNVQEFFELTPIFQIEKDDKNVFITDVEIKYPYCYCWAEYGIPESEAIRLEFWKSISYKTVKGRGTGDRSDELKGVYDAYSEAAKNAVREYARKFIKNKPKEISGEMLIKNNPRLYIESGLFKAELELYLHIEKVISYQFF